jgi:AcrR family transcriptional regulator
MWAMLEESKILSELSAETGQRGPVEHERRQQIIAAADEHFRHYGYEKTTVADLAKAIGMSKAYVYKFFESKQAIGEAICSRCLSEIADAAQAIAEENKPATDRLRRIFKTIAHMSGNLLFRDRKIHDLAVTAISENWGSTHRYAERLLSILTFVVREGRASGEFERKTPLDDTAKAILLSLDSVKHPMVLMHKLDSVDEDATLLVDLVLRSLAP